MGANFTNYRCLRHYISTVSLYSGWYCRKKMYRIGIKVRSRQRINDESESRVWLYYTTAQWLMDHCTLCTKTMFYYNWTTIIYSHESSYKADGIKKRKTLCCSSCFYYSPRYMLHVCTSIYRLIENKPVEFDRLRF